MQKAIELLAPAGTAAIGKKAVNCGADAVYIGAPRFGAREAAGNSIADIEALCRHAHRYRARVYAAVNTILTDAELEEAAGLIGRLYGAGVDGLIIQDLGLLELELPPLPLIASTQMHNCSPERVAFLEKVGFTRAILARELSLQEIAAIRGATTLELECFVHGALCASYSGRCFISCAIGGRSANRGQCAQPCRRSYRLQDGQGRDLAPPAHYLCLKDLNLSADLAPLIDAGVTSFKIEGRLKDAPYVMNAVAWYRRLLDAVLERKRLRKSSSGVALLDFEPDVRKTFNRGYTAYNLRGSAAGCSSPQTPAFVGEPAGIVARAADDCFELAENGALRNGDGICFFTGRGELQGVQVNTVQGRTVYPARMAGIEAGMQLYRNHDHAFMQRLAKSAACRTIALRLELSETPEGYALAATDEDGVTARAEIAARKAAAEKPGPAIATIEKQLGKLGDTDFTCMECTLAVAAIPFLPVAALNELRRACIAALEAERERLRPRPRGGAVRNSEPYPEAAAGFEENVLNDRAAAFLRRHGVSAIEPAAEAGRSLRGCRVMTSKYCLRRELGCCSATSAAGAFPAKVFLVDDRGRRLALRFDCAACRMEVYYGE
jgi:putative protease